jgi:hypothetical protein
VESLARYCRTASEHTLMKLEWWSLLADEDDDEVFSPEVSYDLRKPSPEGAQLVRELATFCRLDAEHNKDWLVVVYTLGPQVPLHRAELLRRLSSLLKNLPVRRISG